MNQVFTRFSTDTIGAVGVDAISRDANVAKSQLYQCFKSKDGLVLAYLEYRYLALWTSFTTSIEARTVRNLLPHPDDDRTQDPATS